MDNSLKNRYTSLNKSFRKKLVFHLGCEAGFFSEYNNMILAMLYCLDNKIQFVLYSKDANFGHKKGWEDYFEPFCEESDTFYIPFSRASLEIFHRNYNIRNYSEYDNIPFKLKDKIKIKLYKIFNNVSYLTQDIWKTIRSRDMENKHYYIPQLGIDGDIRQACSVLIDLTWRYNKNIKEKIDNLISSLNLPHKYAGFHIRQGDKIQESELIDSLIYLKEAERYSDTKNAFILTDDYTVIEQLRKEQPQWNVYTLCPDTDRGYIFSKFLAQDQTEQQNSYLRLFASVDVISQGAFFVGTVSSNPGMYLGMRLPHDKFHSIDLDDWQIW